MSWEFRQYVAAMLVRGDGPVHFEQQSKRLQQQCTCGEDLDFGIVSGDFSDFFRVCLCNRIGTSLLCCPCGRQIPC